MLAYLGRYTHRVAISNARLFSADGEKVAFRWKDSASRPGTSKVMRLATGEFIRRFLFHVLPDGFHRIRHYGLLASAQGARPTSRGSAACSGPTGPDRSRKRRDELIPLTLREPCPCCGGPMRIIETFRRGQQPLSRAPPPERAA